MLLLFLIMVLVCCTIIVVQGFDDSGPTVTQVVGAIAWLLTLVIIAVTVFSNEGVQ